MRRFSRIVLSTAITATALIPSGRVAAQDRRRAEGNELLLAGEGVVFSAAKKAQTFREVPAAVTVITEDDIRRWGYLSVPDILRMAVGVDVMEPNRSQSNVSIRGFNEAFSARLLIMVNGRSTYQDFFGGVFWPVEPLLITSIKRIEIVHGPGSALYGANAFLGVINIITKTPEEQREAGAFTTLNGVGSQNGVFSETLLSGGDAGKLAYTFGGALHQSDGFGKRRSNEIRDSFSSPIFTLDLNHRTRRGNVFAGFRTTDSTADLSSLYYVTDGNWSTRNFSLSYEEEAVKNPILAQYFTTIFRLDDGNVRAIDSITHDFEIQQQRQLMRNHGLVYGANLRANGVRSVLTGPDRHSQSLWGAYAQDEWRLSRATTLFSGLRLDHNTLFGTHVTPRLSVTHQLPADQTLRLSYGTSFRNPTLADTFFNYPYAIAPGVNGAVAGNPNLDAEEITSWELGYRKAFRGGMVSGSVYHNELEGLIDYHTTAFAPSPPFPPGVPLALTRVNGRNARSTGIEVEGSWKISQSIRLLANYAYQSVTDSSGGDVDFSPRHKVNVGVDGDLSHQLSYFVGAHFTSGTRYHDRSSPGSEWSLPGKTSLDARIAYRLGGTQLPVTAAISATNLLNSPRREFPITAMAGAPEKQSAQHVRTVWFTLSGRL